MNKKNGFTLIELLAVILILGIIALIAIPTVNKILDETKKSAFESTLNNIEKKVGDTCSTQLLKEKTYTNAYTISGGSISPAVDLKGKLPDGTITVDNKCNVTYELSDNNYTGIKNDLDDKPIITKRNNINTKILYTESILNGATPKLDDSMIPVAISNDGTVKKADLYSEWYKYDDNDNSNDNSKWANAVITTTASRNSYKGANANTPINQSDIIAYLVWIPRYSYAIPTVTDKSNPSLIKIQFENKGTSKKTGDATGENYYTHPAFTFDGKELDGIWVAKFETTGTASEPTVLPNVASLTNQTVSDEFTTAQSFKTKYGISGDSHMMKNSEWGAAAYLSHSKYGSNNQIRINNYWSDDKTLTGCGASEDDADESNTCGIRYASTTSYPQSTTNNISGIFDMSGGAWECVMGNYKSKLGNSRFTQMPDKKYFDLYTGTNTDITYETACNEGLCKGHANYETIAWYSDYYEVVSSTYPWVDRGGYYSNTSTAGVFQTDYNNGGAVSSHSFRLVVADGA